MKRLTKALSLGVSLVTISCGLAQAQRGQNAQSLRGSNIRTNTIERRLLLKLASRQW